jgi:hypothetical protein
MLTSNSSLNYPASSNWSFIWDRVMPLRTRVNTD